MTPPLGEVDLIEEEDDEEEEDVSLEANKGGRR